MATATAPHSIETPSGRYLDLTNPDPADISLEDIAHNLSNICRFGGACSRFYSVAEHAVLVARHLMVKHHSPSLALAGLHHDDAEAYLGDIPRPLKPLLGERYEELTQSVDEAIAAAIYHWAMPVGWRVWVREADEWALAVEADELLPSRGEGWAGDGLAVPGSGHALIRCWVPELARERFLYTHETLISHLKARAA